MKHDTGAVGPHERGLFALFFFLFSQMCALLRVSVGVVAECGHVVSPATFPSSQRDTLQGGGGPGLTLSDKSFSPFTVPLSERISLSFNPTLLFYSCFCGSEVPPPLHRPPRGPSASLFLHSISFVFYS